MWTVNTVNITMEILFISTALVLATLGYIICLQLLTSFMLILICFPSNPCIMKVCEQYCKVLSAHQFVISEILQQHWNSPQLLFNCTTANIRTEYQNQSGPPLINSPPTPGLLLYLRKEGTKKSDLDQFRVQEVFTRRVAGKERRVWLILIPGTFLIYFTMDWQNIGIAGY